ncbi:hypothetical protein [Chitinophaga qingshengii]|uniref:DUF4372 domain-containing protein n=1 Tax=Chitinophaga qingshengii TaxID=1569794 RepID=A0ABR7TME8_9BACT|nr:hypothetical protein [Chitinophaga qingshengii]MBC9931666.1 hypothetical protein [Chitinophaga qingshengii]
MKKIAHFLHIFWDFHLKFLENICLQKKMRNKTHLFHISLIKIKKNFLKKGAFPHFNGKSGGKMKEKMIFSALLPFKSATSKKLSKFVDFLPSKHFEKSSQCPQVRTIS